MPALKLPESTDKRILAQEILLLMGSDLRRLQGMPVETLRRVRLADPDDRELTPYEALAALANALGELAETVRDGEMEGVRAMMEGDTAQKVRKSETEEKQNAL